MHDVGIYIEFLGRAYCEWAEGTGNRKETHTGTETYLEERQYFIGGRTGKYYSSYFNYYFLYDIEFHLHIKPIHIMRMTHDVFRLPPIAIDETIEKLQSKDDSKLKILQDTSSNSVSIIIDGSLSMTNVLIFRHNFSCSNRISFKIITKI